MTTKSGTAGLVTGLIVTAVVYIFFLLWPGEFLYVLPSVSAIHYWTADIMSSLLIAAGGFWAARWSASHEPWRCAALGTLSGALAGTIVYCLWGAAVAAQFAEPAVIVQQAMTRFVALFLGGAVLGALGGWAACPVQGKQKDVFNKEEPQMAMNAFITAAPASVFAAVLAAALSAQLERVKGFDRTTASLPLLAALLLVFVTHLVVTLVVPHETRQAEHRCGTDEVKMLAFVGIAIAPALVLLLLIVNADCLKNPFVLMTLLIEMILSLISVYTLVTMVLPRRASFPAPQAGKEKAQAVLFGSIAGSYASRLIVLCTGCGLAMALPMVATVISVLIDLRHANVGKVLRWDVFRIQALTCVGLCAAGVAALVLIYMFYLNLGRWFSTRSKG